MCNYINEIMHGLGKKDFDYAKISDDMAEKVRKKMVDEKGYFIKPSELFCNIVSKLKNETASEENAKVAKNLNEELNRIFRSIEGSAVGTASEEQLKGLFSDFAVDNSQLGNTVNTRNELLAKVLKKVEQMDLGKKFEDNSIDTFGDTYEYLMKMYAANAGKSGGEFFTPQEVSEVLARITSHENNVEKVYDPACGSGSLLLKFAKTVGGKKRNDIEYYGQEINPTTYNLCRINMFLHDINFDKFDIQLGDTLHNPLHIDMAGEFDAIVSNPPYSLPWDGKDNTILINDERYAPAGVLAPKSASDLAFTMHMLHHLKESGVCAIVEFPGVLYRTGDEKKIREYLISENRVDTIIQLPQNLFFGVGIPTCIIVLKKSKKADDNVLFIDASEWCVKDGNKNRLTPENQDAIVNAYIERKEVQYKTKLVSNKDILANDCNLTVSSYVEQEDKREKIVIEEVNEELAKVCALGKGLREVVDAIVKNLER